MGSAKRPGRARWKTCMAVATAMVVSGATAASSTVGAGAVPLQTSNRVQASSALSWCGPKKASIALADGFGDNTWRLITRYSAAVEAAKCSSVTKYVYTNGEGNTQKAISDIDSLVATGITAIVDFPDAGKAMLPVLTRAYHAGTIVVPYRVFPGGKAGVNYNAYISTNFVSAGKLWAKDVVTALHGKGEVTFLSGPPANSQGLEEYQGLVSIFKHYPGIHMVGPKPYSVTNWDPATTDQVVASLLAKYPKINAFISDFGTALGGAFSDFKKAGIKIPVIATEDANSVACDYYNLKPSNPNFELFTVSSQTWMVEYAIQYAIALATKGKVPSSTVVPQENYENSLTGKPSRPVCDKSLPATAIMSAKFPPTGYAGLTDSQQLAALAGKIPSLRSLRH